MEKYHCWRWHDEFGKRLIELHDKYDLPNTAVYELPMILSDEIKRKLMRLSAREMLEVLKEGIAEIDCGSVEPLEAIINRREQRLTEVVEW